MRRACLGTLVFALALPSPASADATADAWLAGLQDRMATDILAGQPIVVQVHVPLCDNRIIACGNRKLGDGDNPKTNLYWGTSGGFEGWFGRRRSGWKEVYRSEGDGTDVLQVVVWRREVSPGESLRKRGVKVRFPVYVVAYAWRGTSIDKAVTAYLDDLLGAQARVLPDGAGGQISAGGAAHVVAYVGHNRWMDYEDYDWGDVREHAGAAGAIKGNIAIACLTGAYLAEPLSSAEHVPLLMTSDFLFAGAHAFEGAVSAFVEGGSYYAIRDGAATNYAKGQDREKKVIAYAFVNPSSRRWGKWDD
jgi:hypothetical protein